VKSDQLQTFNNSEIGEIRGFIKDGEPWFLAGQVCRTLGIKDASTAIKDIENRYRASGLEDTISSGILLETNGGKQKVLIIPEPILYELIFKSRKEKALLFRRWVTREVLPSLRKYGQYRMTGKLIHRSLTDTIKEDIIPNIESEMGKRFAYSNFQKMINKSLDLPSKIDKDSIDPETLEKIAHRENLVKAMIEEGKDYHKIKEIIASF